MEREKGIEPSTPIYGERVFRANEAPSRAQELKINWPIGSSTISFLGGVWSGRRGSNPRPSFAVSESFERATRRAERSLGEQRCP
ncbi:MAG: hypothetical protein EA369_02235 [Bradymonadales bacterium]|nr:MAG: hypothetical protein EA369_02235 [Bradymonadales bacterium]